MRRGFEEILLVLALLLGISLSSPMYNVYNDESEPPAIPMRNLKIPMHQIDTSGDSNEMGMYENEIYGRIFKRTHNSKSTVSDTCCPTTIDIIEPSHGKNRAGDLVELYQSDNVRQRFYENSCTVAVADQPCRFLDRRHSSHSRCVQQYSYTYAMVRDITNSDAEWKLDYIQIRSGCSCHISKTLT